MSRVLPKPEMGDISMTQLALGDYARSIYLQARLQAVNRVTKKNVMEVDR